jgi:Malate synthase
MSKMISKYDIKINEELYNFINFEVIPETNIDIEDFWNNFSQIINDFNKINKKLLNKRDIIQKKLDTWHKENSGKEINIDDYTNFFRKIDYLIDEKEDFKIDTKKC